MRCEQGSSAVILSAEGANARNTKSASFPPVAHLPNPFEQQTQPILPAHPILTILLEPDESSLRMRPIPIHRELDPIARNPIAPIAKIRIGRLEQLGLRAIGSSSRWI